MQIQSEAPGKLVDGAIVQLKSTALNLGDRNVLGAFADSPDCYYWREVYNNKRQGWQITKKDRGEDHKIRYRDEVYFTNLHYKSQNLSRDARHQSYLTTVFRANEW